jgi:hypothetical protein
MQDVEGCSIESFDDLEWSVGFDKLSQRVIAP